jgi:hypothetical protein
MMMLLRLRWLDKTSLVARNRGVYALGLARMTVTDLDIWRAANILLKRHGDEAAVVAAQRADALLSAGDVEGEIVWKRIGAAVVELQRRERHADEALN